jgi:predicted protein tyrosine phosphatase
MPDSQTHDRLVSGVAHGDPSSETATRMAVHCLAGVSAAPLIAMIAPFTTGTRNVWPARLHR